MAAESGCVVEQSDGRGLEKLVVVFGGLLVKKSPVMEACTGQR